MQDWIFPQDIDPDELKPYAGFIYVITHKATGRAYIGRKYLTTMRKARGSTRRKSQPSDWKTYWGSCDRLNADIEAEGHDAFERRILSFYSTRGQVNYAETREQFIRDVLTAQLPNGERAYYNNNIASRWYAAKPKTRKSPAVSGGAL
ncbi:hypothetical protein [Brevundimonas sp.]|uniref:hypothetical protein n=1 Tax=Brevundimonas sp. TaxID=1871086 RepID=UPI00289F13A0|nr:hypothetical protein [Brevundimonas sp.]